LTLRAKEVLNYENPKFQASNYVVQTAKEFVTMKRIFKRNKKSSKCYHQEQIKWSGNFVFDEIITIIPGTKYTAQGN